MSRNNLRSALSRRTVEVEKPEIRMQSDGMPELPDISAYISALESRIVGQPLQRIRLASPFLLRTVQPPLASAEGRTDRKSVV